MHGGHCHGLWLESCRCGKDSRVIEIFIMVGVCVCKCVGAVLAVYVLASYLVCICLCVCVSELHICAFSYFDPCLCVCFRSRLLNNVCGSSTKRCISPEREKNR